MSDVAKTLKDSDVLEAVLKLIAAPPSWTTAALAREAGGNPCDPCDDKATSWSVPGAVQRVTGDPDAWRQRIARHVLAFSPGLGKDGQPITHERVMMRLHGAIMHAHLVEKMGSK